MNGTEKSDPAQSRLPLQPRVQEPGSKRQGQALFFAGHWWQRCLSYPIERICSLYWILTMSAWAFSLLGYKGNWSVFRDKGTCNSINAWKIKTDRYTFFSAKSHWTFPWILCCYTTNSAWKRRKGVRSRYLFPKCTLDREQQASDFRFRFNDTVSCALALTVLCSVFLHLQKRLSLFKP